MTRLVLALLPIAATLQAQSHSGPRPAMAHDLEVPLARSATPAEISGKAGVWFWNGRGSYVPGIPSSNGVNCFLSRQWIPSVEPQCFDEEASATILPILIRRIELYYEGKSTAEVEAAIAEGLKDGTFRLPKRPAVTYMMSAAQQLVAPFSALIVPLKTFVPAPK